VSSPVLLVIDVGNTNVSLGVYDYEESGEGTLSQHWRVSTHREQTSDELVVSRPRCSGRRVGRRTRSQT